MKNLCIHEKQEELISKPDVMVSDIYEMNHKGVCDCYMCRMPTKICRLTLRTMALDEKCDCKECLSFEIRTKKFTIETALSVLSLDLDSLDSILSIIEQFHNKLSVVIEDRDLECDGCHALDTNIPTMQGGIFSCLDCEIKKYEKI